MIQRSALTSAGATRPRGLALVARALPALLLACGGAEPADEDAEPPPVCAPLTQGVAIDALTLRGPVRAAPGAELHPAAGVAGVVRRVLHAEGDRVRAGEALVELDPAPLAEAERAAGADADEARVTRDAAEAVARRRSDLLARGVVAQAQVDAARADLAAAEARLAAASARRSAATLDRDRAVVRAARDGVVGPVFAQPGAAVDPTTPLLVLIDPSAAEVTAAAPAWQASRLTPGQPATIAGDEATSIGAVGPADPVTGLATVRIPTARSIGGFVSVQVETARREGAWFAPASALTWGADGHAHLTRCDGERVEVEVGPTADGRAEVRGADLAGLTVIDPLGRL